MIGLITANQPYAQLAIEDFYRRYTGVEFSPIVVVMAAYQEAANIAAVIDYIPEQIAHPKSGLNPDENDQTGNLKISTLVVVDGGNDGTDRIALEHGAYVCRLPSRQGQGVALGVGYELAVKNGASYIVTIDADGQNDPREIPQLFKPLLSDQADFVIASRRLGTDETTNTFRKIGVRLFSTVINLLTGQHLTDTSNGFRALKADIFKNITLKQSQYQTAELIIRAIKHGYQIIECPSVWHPRSSGHSKKGNDLMFGLRYAKVITTTFLEETFRRPPT